MAGTALAAQAPPGPSGTPGVPGTSGTRGRAGSRRGGSPLTWFGMPVLLAVILGGTYLWVSSLELDSIEQRTLNAEQLTQSTIEHLHLTAVSTAIVIVLAIPLGVLLSRPFARPVVPAVLGLANIGQGVPSFGLITIVILWTSLGFWPMIIGLVACSTLPILRNTMVGLEQVDRTAVKASRGMGMSPLQVLLKVELPLAFPVMIAGIRTALIINVGTAALGTFFGQGGLGFIIYNGITLNRTPVLITGVVLVSALALLVDYLAGALGRLLAPRGL